MGSSRKCTTPLSLPTTTVLDPAAPAKLQQVRPVSAMKKPSTEPAREPSNVSTSIGHQLLRQPIRWPIHLIANSSSAISC